MIRKRKDFRFPGAICSRLFRFLLAVAQLIRFYGALPSLLLHLHSRLNKSQPQLAE